MGFSRVVLAVVLCLFSVLSSAYPESIAPPFDARTLSEVFDFPLGWDPVPEDVVINGKPEFRITYKTRVPFSKLKAYYLSLLSQNQWIYCPFQEMSSFFSKGAGNQLMFMKGKLLILMTYLNGPKENGLMLTLMEGAPLMLPEMKAIKPFLVENIVFPNCEPVLQFLSKNHNLKNETGLITFKTPASVNFMISYFDREIMKKGWERTPALEMIRGELEKLPQLRQKDFLKNLQIYRKNADKFLFFFASENSPETGCIFGYFYKTTLISSSKTISL